MAEYNYITADDITDNLTVGSDMSSYISDANDAIEHLAKEKQVDIEKIKTDPIDYKLKKYGIYYAIMLFLLDKAGTNNNDFPADIEKYKVKYEIYKRLIKEIYDDITWQMIAGDADNRSDYAGVKRMYIG